MVSDSSSSPPDSLAPSPALTLPDVGIPRPILEDLLLKTLYIAGCADGHTLGATLKLAASVVKELAGPLLASHLLTKDSSERWALSENGRTEARRAFDHSRYVGPAPVSLADYSRQCSRQAPFRRILPIRKVREACRDLILTEATVEFLAASATLGHSLLLTSPAGFGKATLASRFASLVVETGGIVYQPWSLLIDRNILSVFDPALHHPAVDRGECDPRWVSVKRPIVWQAHHPAARDMRWPPLCSTSVSSVPEHLQANGGVFLIDCLTRSQAAATRERWAPLLESGVDDLLLPDGRTLRIPVNQLTVILCDESGAEELGTLRIRSQLRLTGPTRDDLFVRFLKECDRRNLPFRESVFDEFWTEVWSRQSAPRWRDPPDLLDAAQAISRCREETECVLTTELLRQAARQRGWPVSQDSDWTERRCA